MPDSPLLRPAFVSALDPQGPLTEVFAQELRAALPWLSAAAAQESAADILVRRRAEKAAGSDGESWKGWDRPGLPPKKIQELVDSLVQPHTTPSGAPAAEALIHIHANLNAQRQLHAALAGQVFRAGGGYERMLAAALKDAAPALPDADIQNAAAGFVRLRRERAQATADALAPDGTVERQAVAQAARIRGGKAAPAPQGQDEEGYLSLCVHWVKRLFNADGEERTAGAAPVDYRRKIAAQQRDGNTARL